MIVLKLSVGVHYRGVSGLVGTKHWYLCVITQWKLYIQCYLLFVPIMRLLRAIGLNTVKSAKVSPLE